MRTTLAQCEPQKTLFLYKGNTLSKRFRGQVPRAQIQVCVSTKKSSWLRGGAICDFWPFLLLPHFSSEMPNFYSAKRRGPRTGFKEDPEPPRFLKKRGPPGTCPAYIYIYIYIAVELLAGPSLAFSGIWSKFVFFFLTLFVETLRIGVSALFFEQKKFRTKLSGVIIWSKAAIFMLQQTWPR